MDKTRPVDSYFICDAHADTLSRGVKKRSDLYDFPEAQLDLRRLEESGVRLQFFAVFVNPAQNPAGEKKPYLEQIDYYREQLIKHRKRLKPVLSSDDLPTPSSPFLVHSLLSVEGGECLEGQVYNLDLLYEQGVRSLGLTWNYNNQLGHGASDRSGQGLTGFGRRVIAAMNNRGMLVDAAHLSEATFWETLDRSEVPIIVSHSCCRALNDHPRNLSDRQMEALAGRGGLMGITLVNDFLGEEPGVERFIDHIIHAVRVMGPEHVAIGSDFDGVEVPVPGLEDASRLPSIATGMLRRGIRAETAAQVLGGNLLRLLGSII
ncbi:MAG: dipeptidase [Firmicutes bacterium]|nr:dipeptidase [Bacillota bacterium]